MTHYINIREDLFRWSCSSTAERGPYKAWVVGSNPTKTTKETLYPLTHACSGYFKRINKCKLNVDALTGKQSVEPLNRMVSGNLNNMEAQEDINHFCNPQTYDESYWGCPATGHPCPKKLKEGEG